MPLDNDEFEEEKPKGKEVELFEEDSHEPGDYNQETTFKGLRTISKPVPIPVFGMRRVHQGANPYHQTPEPVSKTLTESEVRDKMLRHALDTQGLIAELKVLVKVGAIAMTVENIKKLADAEKSNGELLLRTLDKENKQGFGSGDKSIALSIINNVMQVVDGGFEKALSNARENPQIAERLEAVHELEATVMDLPEPTKQTPVPEELSVEDYAKLK